MHLEEVEGIVTSETNYSETSKIINVITKEHGLIGIMAKGARSLKSPFRSVTSKLTYGKFIIYYKENKLSTLKEVSYEHSRTQIPRFLRGYASLRQMCHMRKKNRHYNPLKLSRRLRL